MSAQLPRLLYAPRSSPQPTRRQQPQQRGFANYAPANYRIDARAPQATPNLDLTAPHDFSGFDKFFHPQPKAASTPNAMTAMRSVNPAFTGNVPAAPADIHGSVVQGLLDKASGVKAPPANPANRVTQVSTPYGSGSVGFAVGKGMNASTPAQPIVENGVQVGVGRGQPFDINAARNNLYAAHPEVFTPGTPENKAFADYANKNGEEAAHQNITQIMQPFVNERVAHASGPAQDVAAVKDLPSPGSTADVEAQQSIAKNMPQTSFRTGSVLDKAARALNSASSANPADAIESGVQSGLQSLGVQPEAAKSAAPQVTGALANVATAGLLPAVKGVVSGVRSLFTPGAPANDSVRGVAQVARNAVSPTPPDFPPAGQPGGRPGGTGGVTAPLPAAPAATSSDFSGPPAPSTARETVQQRVNALNNDQALEDTRSVQPQATNDETPNYALGLKPNRKTLSLVPNYARGYMSNGEGDFGLGLDFGRPSFVQNSLRDQNEDQSSDSTPFTPQPTSAPTTAQRSEAGSWRKSMDAANGALKSDYAAAGLPAPNITTEQLAGPDGPLATVPGHGVPNYAKGNALARMRSVAPAMARERDAIKKGVGGARPGDKPVAMVLNNHPAVVNSGEKIAQTPAGTVVMNRNQQQRQILDRKTLSMPNMAHGGVLIAPSHKGRLHRALNVPLDRKIPAARIAAAKHSFNPHMRKMATFAQNFSH